MALTKLQFQNAVSYLTRTGILSGILFIDANNQIVLDEGNANLDVTPDEPTLTQALIDLQAAQDADVVNDARQSGAKTQFSSIPVYATMTEQQAIDYITTNVADLASAKVVLIALARMVIALRNNAYPDLEGS